MQIVSQIASVSDNPLPPSPLPKGGRGVVVRGMHAQKQRLLHSRKMTNKPKHQARTSSGVRLFG